MSHNQEEITGVVKNYTQTTLLSFLIMFCLFISFSRCHGSYEPSNTHHATNNTEHHTEPTHH